MELHGRGHFPPGHCPAPSDATAASNHSAGAAYSSSLPRTSTPVENERDTVPALLRARAIHSPGDVAYEYETQAGWRAIRWDEFSRRVHHLANGLVGRGLQVGDHVGILAPTGLAWELFHHAVLLAGGVVVGLEPHDVPERLQRIAEHADLRMLVVGDSTLLGKLGREQIARYRCVIVLEAAARSPGGIHTIGWEDFEENEKVPQPLPPVRPDFPATLIYTSGTTGQPKGILYRHQQVVLAVHAIARAYPSIDIGARFVCWLPLSNLFQRIMNLAALSVGGTTHLVKDPLTVTRVLPRAKPDVFIGVPRFYEKLHEGIERAVAQKTPWQQSLIRAAIRAGDRMAQVKRKGGRVPLTLAVVHRVLDALVLHKLRGVMGGRVRFMITGSAPTSLRLLEFFDALGLPLYEAYGLSENIVPMALNRPQARRLGTVGQPLQENTLAIEPDGELLVKGLGVFAGYHKDERSDAFNAEGFYRTGDYASVDADGFLRLLGRKSEIIKTSTGRRLSPLGIESALESIPAISRAIVVGAGRKCLAAILIVTADGQVEGSADLIQAYEKSGIPSAFSTDFSRQLERACEALAAPERPVGFVVSKRELSVAAGDLTPNLKLRRRAVEERYAALLDEVYAVIDRKPGQIVLRVALDED